MKRPIRITQTWVRGNGSLSPVVYVKENHITRAKKVGKKVWFELIKEGFMTPNKDLQNWLNMDEEWIKYK